MKEQKEEKKKIQKWPIIVLALVLILTIGITFAWLRISVKSDTVNTIKAGSLSMVLDDEASDGILLQKAIPMSYQEGMTTTEYTFTLTNNGSKSDYTISLLDEATYTNDEGTQVTIADKDKLADTKIRYILLKDGEEASASKSILLSEAVNRVIDSGTIENGKTITYSLRIWIDSKAGDNDTQDEVMGKIFNARLQLYATQHHEVAATTLCKRATTLHTAECMQTNAAYYCSGDGYITDGTMGTTTITYGNLGTSGTLATGDAFDCDVNGDGTYDAPTERFYYVSDMTNGITPDSNTAVLIYYNNVSGGEPSNSSVYLYASGGGSNNTNGPVTALEQLPTTTQWSNVSLTSTTRAITNENGGTTTSAGDLPTAFSYEGYAARLLTYQEVNTGCFDGTTEMISTKGLSNKCKFLFENTKYSSESMTTYGYWLETPRMSSFDSAWHTFGLESRIHYDTVYYSPYFGVRPVIEVSKSNISY